MSDEWIWNRIVNKSIAKYLVDQSDNQIMSIGVPTVTLYRSAFYQPMIKPYYIKIGYKSTKVLRDKILF